jgi:hypothetical protein
MRSFNSLGLDREDGACETLVGKSVLLELVGLSPPSIGQFPSKAEGPGIKTSP